MRHRGECSSRTINRRISGRLADRPRTHATIPRRPERVLGRGRARHDSHGGGTGERSSDMRRSTVERTLQSGKPPQCQQAFTGTSSLYENRRRCKTSKMLSHTKSAPHETPNLRVSPLAAVVANKVRAINGFSFEEQRRERREKYLVKTDKLTRIPFAKEYAP